MTNTLQRYRVIYSTPISSRSVQIINAYSVEQAIATVKKMEIPVTVKEVEVQISKRKWRKEYDQN